MYDLRADHIRTAVKGLGCYSLHVMRRGSDTSFTEIWTFIKPLAVAFVTHLVKEGCTPLPGWHSKVKKTSILHNLIS